MSAAFGRLRNGAGFDELSTRIMSACWPLQMPPTQKAVLISLADNANDEGFCWPSIDAISERTCFGRTAVIESIKWLEAHGHLTANRANGRKTTYTITVNQSGKRTALPTQEAVEVSANQSATRTGTADGPVRQTDQTSPAGGRDQSGRRTLTVINRKEPSKARAGSRAAERPDLVPESVWLDFLAIRKAKRAPLTDTALDGIASEAEKAGLSLPEALAVCCRQGWQGFNVGWYENLVKSSKGARVSAAEPWAGAI